MTVTRALNDSSQVTVETRNKVLAACRKLKFRKNLVASSLRSKKSHALALIVPTFKHEFYSRLLADIEDEARKKHYCIIAAQLQLKNGRREILTRDKIENLCSRGVDGIIIDADFSEEIEQLLLAEQIPVVCINRAGKLHQFDYITTDYHEIFARITQSLLAKGHRRIAFVGGFADRQESSEFYLGFCQALLKQGIQPDPQLYLACGFFFENGVEAAGVLVSSGKEFSAVVGINDYIAIGLISGFHQLGLKVPDQVAVTGHAGENITRFFVPTVTTAEQPVRQIAKESVRRLIYKINNPQDDGVMVLRLKSTLQERQSSNRILMPPVKLFF